MAEMADVELDSDALNQVAGGSRLCYTKLCYTKNTRQKE
jgi:hypothetical protein